MYPNQQPNGQPPQTPRQFEPLPDQSQFDTGYLDQIAAPIQQKKANPFLIWGMIGGVLLAAVIFLAMISSNSAPTPTQRIASSLARVQSLKKVTQDNTQNIKDSKLRASNSNLSSILSGMENEFTSQLSPKEAKEKNEAIESEFSPVSEKLEDARLNERFDTVYAREVSYQIKQIRAELLLVYDDIKSKKFQQTLVEEDKSLKDLNNDFSKFNTD